MAKFRTNHDKSKSGGGMIVKVGIFGILMGGAFWLFNLFTGNSESTTEDEPTVIVDPKEIKPGAPKPTEISDYFFPSSTTGQIVKHAYYALSYSETHELAEWVAYELTREMLAPPFAQRTDDFRPDPKIRKASASHRDYTNTGYDRGHLVPAADMSFDERAMSETFYMSNVSPQIRNFNSGIWKELEFVVRDWARQFKHIYVVTGPVLSRNVREQIGNNQVSVPDEYYKVIVDFTEPDLKGIAFIIPNEVSYESLASYAVTIDYIENITGIDFFEEMFSEDDELEIEGRFDISEWPMNEKRFKERTEVWNRKK